MRKYFQPALATLVVLASLFFARDSRAATYTQQVCPVGTMQVDVLLNNVYIYCQAGNQQFSWFAYPVSDNAATANALTAGWNSRFQACVNKSDCQITVYYDSNSADNPPGCGASNCRALNAVSW